jgi:hypothetical protein
MKPDCVDYAECEQALADLRSALGAMLALRRRGP